MVTDRYQATITMSKEMRDDIDAHRHPATSRSEWVRKAIEARLAAEDQGEWDEIAAEEETDDSNSQEVEKPATPDEQSYS